MILNEVEWLYGFIVYFLTWVIKKKTFLTSVKILYQVRCYM